MKIKLHQLNYKDCPQKDLSRILCNLESIKPTDVKAEWYAMTFEGVVNAKDLEEIYSMFQDNPDHKGNHSFSMGDIVEVMEGIENLCKGLYMCQAEGFTLIPNIF